MLPRFLVLSKYELRKYRGSIADEAIIVLIVLAGFMMLITPEIGQTSLPSSHNIYRIGYPEGTVLGRLQDYSIQFIPFYDSGDMISASGLNQIDGFGIYSKGRIVVFGSGTRKSDAALSHLDTLIIQFNTNRIFDYISSDANLTGILLPLRIQLMPEEIDYAKASSGETDAERRRIAGLIRFGPNRSAASSRPLDLESLNVTVDPASSKVLQTAADNPSAGNGTYTTGNMTLPTDLSVEFPFKTLYQNMGLLSPLMLLSILLALSLSKERMDKTVENLFETPLTNAEILLGKSFPYLAGMVVLSLLYGLYVTLSLEALKIALVFIALSFAMVSFGFFSVLISRSYRELTFIGSFSMFAFFLFIILPNVFSGVNVLSFISPLDIVTSIENGASITYPDLALSLLPYGFLGMFFLSFTGVCFNAEVVSSSSDFRKLLGIFYSTLSRILRNGITYVFVAVSLQVPFIFIIESILAYLAMPLGRIAPIVSLLLLATIEELVKIVPYGYRKMNPIIYGITAGTAFFVMEKLFNLYLVVKVYSYLGGPYVLFFTKLLPTLGLHIISTTLFAAIIYRSRKPQWLILGLAVSVTVHFIYNYMLITGLA